MGSDPSAGPSRDGVIHQDQPDPCEHLRKILGNALHVLQVCTYKYVITLKNEKTNCKTRQNDTTAAGLGDGVHSANELPSTIRPR